MTISVTTGPCGGPINVTHTYGFSAPLPLSLSTIPGSDTLGAGCKIEVDANSGGSVTIDMYQNSSPVTSVIGVGTDSCIVTVP